MRADDFLSVMGSQRSHDGSSDTQMLQNDERQELEYLREMFGRTTVT